MKTEKKILNLGCGNSDYGTHRIDIVKTKTTTEICDVNKEKLPYENNFFDEVYARNFWEHLPNPLNVLLEMKRVCKKGGKIKVITDNAEYMIFHISRAKGHLFKLRGHHGGRFDYSESKVSTNEDDFHYGIYTIEHMRNFIRISGLEEEKIWVDNFDEPSKLTRFILFLSGLIYPRKGRFKPKLKFIAKKI